MRIKAFTLLEMLVVMVLSVIVVGVGYLMFDQINMLNKELQIRNQNSQALLMLDANLRIDTQQSQGVSATSSGFEFIKLDGTQISYQINAAGVERKSHATNETFNISFWGIRVDSNEKAKILSIAIGNDSLRPDTLSYEIRKPESARE